MTNTDYQSDRQVSGWVGWVAFAAILLLMLGLFQAFWGLLAIFRNEEVFLVGEQNLPVEVDYTAWGWASLILGIIIAITGVALLSGQTWARIVAVVLAVLSVISNLGSISAYPLWSIVLIAIGVLVIYAVVVHGSEARAL